MNFPSLEPWDHDKEFPHFRAPKIIGEFSVDGERKVRLDRSQLQLLRPVAGQVNFNLKEGFTTRIPKDFTSEGLDNMLTWILHNRKMFNVEKKNLATDFICFRGLLRLLLNTPYEQRDPWIIRITRWQDTIYLLQEDTQEEKDRKENLTERDKKFTYWGYRFEKYMSAMSKEEIRQPLNEKEEFCCMFRTRIGDLSVMYGAEMDGYKAKDRCSVDRHLVPNKFVELKTNRVIETERQDRNWRKFKLIKWWAQSFLVGIEDIMCGWRDDHGIVSEVEKIAVKDIPKMGMDWKANVSANFLLEFLSFVKRNINANSLEKVYRVVYQPGSGFSLREEEGRSTFLPDWFTNQIFRNCKEDL